MHANLRVISSSFRERRHARVLTARKQTARLTGAASPVEYTTSSNAAGEAGAIVVRARVKVAGCATEFRRGQSFGHPDLDAAAIRG